MGRNRIFKGQEKIVYVDGVEIEVKFHGISSYERTNLRRIYRDTQIDKKGNLTKTDFHDDDYMIAVLKRSVGNQMSEQDLKDMDKVITEDGEKDALSYLFKKYFGEITKAKKSK